MNYRDVRGIIPIGWRMTADAVHASVTRVLPRHQLLRLSHDRGRFEYSIASLNGETKRQWDAAQSIISDAQLKLETTCMTCGDTGATYDKNTQRVECARHKEQQNV